MSARTGGSQRRGGTLLHPALRRVPVKTIYLEQTTRTADSPPATPPNIAFQRWTTPPLSAYRELFETVGSPWGWTGRLLLSDPELESALHAPTTEVWRLRRGGETIGFAELVLPAGDEVKILYLGLVPSAMGQGLGRLLLQLTLEAAWRHDPRRVWLHTCEYDAPGALENYLSRGFRVVDERVEVEPYPREFLARRGVETEGR